MSDYENGTVYGKYIKIKKGTNGVRQCADYINDPVKINPLLENGETEVPSSQKLSITSKTIQKPSILQQKNVWYPGIIAVQTLRLRSFLLLKRFTILTKMKILPQVKHLTKLFISYSVIKGQILPRRLSMKWDVNLHGVYAAMNFRR